MIFNPVRYGGGSVKTTTVRLTIKSDASSGSTGTLYYTLNQEAKTMGLSAKLFHPESIAVEMDVNSIAMVYFKDSYGGFTIGSGGTGLGNSSFRVSA